MSIELIVMRLADVVRVHPQITSGGLGRKARINCCRCGEAVGVNPSGQRVLQENYNVEVICQVCKAPPDVIPLTPGVGVESFESKVEVQAHRTSA